MGSRVASHGIPCVPCACLARCSWWPRAKCRAAPAPRTIPIPCSAKLAASAQSQVVVRLYWRAGYPPTPPPWASGRRSLAKVSAVVRCRCKRHMPAASLAPRQRAQTQRTGKKQATPKCHCVRLLSAHRASYRQQGDRRRGCIFYQLPSLALQLLKFWWRASLERRNCSSDMH